MCDVYPERFSAQSSKDSERDTSRNRVMEGRAEDSWEEGNQDGTGRNMMRSEEEFLVSDV